VKITEVAAICGKFQGACERIARFSNKSLLKRMRYSLERYALLKKGKPSYLQTLRVEEEPMIEARLFSGLFRKRLFNTPLFQGG
jgi:hypothetical protein